MTNRILSKFHGRSDLDGHGHGTSRRLPHELQLGAGSGPLDHPTRLGDESIHGPALSRGAAHLFLTIAVLGCLVGGMTSTASASRVPNSRVTGTASRVPESRVTGTARRVPESRATRSARRVPYTRVNASPASSGHASKVAS